jgi:hypothetical protein
MAVLLNPLVLVESAPSPVAVLPLPIVLPKSANAPVAVLSWPVLLKSASKPVAVLLEPVMLLLTEIAQVHGCFSSQSFWKAGSERNGSQSGSSLRRAGVTGVRL